MKRHISYFVYHFENGNLKLKGAFDRQEEAESFKEHYKNKIDPNGFFYITEEVCYE